MSSKNSPVILVRADASSSIGSGHVMRCLALAKAWQGTGGTVSWILTQTIPVLDGRLQNEGIACMRSQLIPGSIPDALQTATEARRTNAAWVVVDGYDFVPNFVKALKASGCRVLFIDDDGRFESYEADVVLNQNVSATPAMYVNRGSSTQLLLGSAYVLLRSEFLKKKSRREQPKNADNVLITMGGSDPENLTEKALRALDGLDIRAKVVVGSGNARRDALCGLASRVSPQIEIEEDPGDMATLMAWADVAISAAGSTSWELAYMGVPAILIESSADQRGIAKSLEQLGIALTLGWHANLWEETIRDALLDLLPDHDRRIEMSERGQRLIDGRGAIRAVEFLQNL